MNGDDDDDIQCEECELNPAVLEVYSKTLDEYRDVCPKCYRELLDGASWEPA